MKKTLKTWEAIVAHAYARAEKSLKRNDPVAWAYWRETALFAEQCRTFHAKPEIWKMGAFDCVQKAKLAKAHASYMESALWYSRAKWFVILARANGIVMHPGKTGVNLEWLKEDEKGVGDAIARPVAAAY